MKTAICLLAFNRPAYQKKVWESVQKTNPGHDVIIFVDGLVDFWKGSVRQKDLSNYKSCHALIENLFPDAQVFRNSLNAGCQLQWGAIFANVFDVLGYDRCYVIEDDLVLSDGYFKTCDRLLKMFEGDMRVGMVKAFGERLRQDHDQYLHCLSTAGHLWGVATWKNRWETWKKDYYEFSRIIMQEGKETYVQSALSFFQSLGGGNSGVANDAAFYHSMLRQGQIPISTVANCAEYIGEVGEWGVPEYYREAGYSKMPVVKDDLKFDYPPDDFFQNALSSLRKEYGFA